MLKENQLEYKLIDAEDYDTSEDCVHRTQENLLAALSYSIHEEIGELDIIIIIIINLPYVRN